MSTSSSLQPQQTLQEPAAAAGRAWHLRCPSHHPSLQVQSQQPKKHRRLHQAPSHPGLQAAIALLQAVAALRRALLAATSH